MRKKIIVTSLMLVIGVILIVFYWPSKKLNENEIQDLKQLQVKELNQAKKLVEQRQNEAALSIIQKYDKELSARTELGSQWRNLFITIAEQNKNLVPLVVLYQSFPESFRNHETASLLVGNSLAESNDKKGYAQLREQWKNRETQKEKWLLLDADVLLLEGKKNEANQLLQTESFKGKQDVARLIKLALINVYDDPQKAWEYLNEAYIADPTNGTIRSYRGKLLEVSGKKELALSEYLAAVQTEPENPFLKDQLADFYQRHGQFSQALKIWSETLLPPTQDFIWLKALFWNKVIFPISFDWRTHALPNGPLKPLIDYILTLKPGQFWDSTTFSTVPFGKTYLDNSQVTFWLQLLQALKENNETYASQLLNNQKFSQDSWDPPLEQALKIILQFRKTKNFSTQEKPAELTNTSDPSNVVITSITNDHPLFQQLNSLSATGSKEQVPKDLDELLLSPEIFSATFLAAGWLEAGLQLHILSVIPEIFPEWVSYNVAQALRANRGNMEALLFAKRQKLTPSLSLLIGELFIADGDVDAALEQLKSIPKKSNKSSYRAAWLSSLIYIDKGEYDKAKEAIESEPSLAQDTLGKETLAKIALKQNNPEKAELIYFSIKDKSIEAKSYFARKAFQQKNFETARKLTEEMLREHPDELQLRENYEKIIEEEKKENSAEY